MMSISLSTFFWLSVIYMYIKYKFNIHPYFDMVFVVIITIFMYFINVNLMQTKCGSYSNVYVATLMPWIFMLGLMMFALHIFPSWKTPFSNTFGYMVVRIFGATDTLKGVLTASSLDKVYQDPSLLINQFTSTTIPDTLKKYPGVFIERTPPTESLFIEFEKMVRLKEFVSEWIWYMLTATVAISTSYTMIMNTSCTKSVDDYVTSHKIAMVNVKPTTDTMTYNVNE